MSRMSQLAVSSKHSDLSESFHDDASYDDKNAVAKPSIVQELCACIKKAEQKSTCKQGNSSAVPSPLPLSRSSSLPPPPSSLLRSPPQHTHTHDTSQLQSGTMTQSPVAPLVSDPVNSLSPQMQVSQVLMQPAVSPQPGAYLPSNSSSLVHTQLPSQTTSVQLPPQPQPIPHASSANVGYHTQPHSVGHSGNFVVQQPIHSTNCSHYTGNCNSIFSFSPIFPVLLWFTICRFLSYFSCSGTFLSFSGE